MTSITKQVTLFYKDYRSDKEYHLTLERNSGGYRVIAKYGPRGGTLTHVDKTKGYVGFLEALEIFNKTESEKQSKGYVDKETPRQKLIKRLESELTMDYRIMSASCWEEIAGWIEAYVEEQT